MRGDIKRRGRVAVAAAVIAFALAGCTPATASPFVGTWGASTESAQPSLELSADGEVVGSDGCNRLVGTWSEDDGVARLNQLASTRMACLDVDDWLSRADSARIVAGELIIRDAEGTEIGVLEASDAARPLDDTLRVFLDVVLIASIVMIASFGSMIVVRSVHEDGIAARRSLWVRFATATSAGLMIIALAIALIMVTLA